jgi:acyl carrier protein
MQSSGGAAFAGWVQLPYESLNWRAGRRMLHNLLQLHRFSMSKVQGKPMQARELLAEILRSSTPIPPGEIPLSQLDGWDSLKGVRLVLRLEEIIGRELSEDSIEKLQSVEDVDRLLKAA